jgi:hypothetical protein
LASLAAKKGFSPGARLAKLGRSARLASWAKEGFSPAELAFALGLGRSICFASLAARNGFPPGGKLPLAALGRLGTLDGAAGGGALAGE